MVTYFVISSPLQCFFASIISKGIKGKKIALYYDYGKSFFQIYPKIVELLHSKFDSIEKLSDFNLKQIKKEDSFFFCNRYSIDEIDLFHKIKGKVKECNLYEEGLNTYLDHHFNNPNLNDRSLKLKAKNIVKRCFMKLPSHIYLRQFSNVYSSFPIDYKNVNNIKITTDEFENGINNSETKSCLFLSQTLAVDGFLSLTDYHDWLFTVIGRLTLDFDLVYYKAHPRDNEETIKLMFEKFPNKIRLLPDYYNDLPAELFLIKNLGITLFGFFSSTLVYYASLMNGQSYQLLSRITEDFSQNERLKVINSSMSTLFEQHKISSMSDYELNAAL